MADNRIASSCPYGTPRFNAKLAQSAPDESGIELTLIGMLKNMLQASRVADDGIPSRRSIFRSISASCAEGRLGYESVEHGYTLDEMLPRKFHQPKWRIHCALEVQYLFLLCRL